MIQALFLIFVGIGIASTINVIFDWRRNKHIDKWNEERRYLPACASAGTVWKESK